MMLVEIILGKKTGDTALATAIDYVRAIKKTPIVVNDTRGFYVNRCVLRYMSEAYQMLIEGVPAPMIENAARMAGMPVGPLALTDETAVDLAQKIMKQTIRDLGEKAVDKDQMALINTMVDKHGRFGRKNGKGFYDYPPKPAKKKLWPGLKDLYPQQDPDKIDVEELKQRFLVTIALEASRVMEEGIVTDPREADVGSILAFGFAPFTGGTLSYIDGMGAAKFVKLAKALQKKYGAAVQGAEAACRDGREGSELLRALRSLRQTGGEGSGLKAGRSRVVRCRGGAHRGKSCNSKARIQPALSKYPLRLRCRAGFATGSPSALRHGLEGRLDNIVGFISILLNGWRGQASDPDMQCVLALVLLGLAFDIGRKGWRLSWVRRAVASIGATLAIFHVNLILAPGVWLLSEQFKALYALLGIPSVPTRRLGGLAGLGSQPRRHPGVRFRQLLEPSRSCT